MACSQAATCGIPFHRHLWDGFLQEGTWGSLSPPGGGSRQAPALIQSGREDVLHVGFKGGDMSSDRDQSQTSNNVVINICIGTSNRLLTYPHTPAQLRMSV